MALSHFSFNSERNPETRAETEKIQQKMVHFSPSNNQKELRINASQKLLSMLGMYTEHYFAGIATRDASWFQYSSYSDSMFADSRESVMPRIQQDISG
jgi:hypothetical protein